MRLYICVYLLVITMISEPQEFSWPPHIKGNMRLVSYTSKDRNEEYPSFDSYRNDDRLYNEVNWRWFRNGAISKEEFEKSTRQNYERNIKERKSFLGLFMVNELITIVRTEYAWRIYISLNWSGKPKNWADVELNLYNFKKYYFFEEKEIFASAYTVGTRRITRGSLEHIVGGESPGDEEIWRCKGEFEVTWNSKELKLIGRSEKARNGVRNAGYGEEATFLLT